jgi:nucleotide-binding universal stress UspA family protein
MESRNEPIVLERVLCATDFSANAAAALESAVAIARPSKAEILVVHVLPFPVRSAVGVVCQPRTTDGVDDATPADLLERLDRFARPAIAAGAETGRILRHGDPSEEIVGEAHRVRADLIVMGRHSRDASARVFLGSVAEGVVSRATCPVMVVQACPRRRARRPRRVLCGVDLGETAAPTLRYAAALTTALEAELLLLHVVARPEEGAVRDAGTRLAAIVACAPVTSGRVQHRVVAGKPYEEILAMGRANRVDLVVVGSHARGTVHRPFIGSTTLHLLRRSDCAVLVVPSRVIAETTVEDFRSASPEA